MNSPGGGVSGRVSGVSAASVCASVIAFWTAFRKRCSSMGLTRNSCAPARIAATALLIEPLAVMTITCASGLTASMSCNRSSPSRSGSIRSRSTTAGFCVRNIASPAAAVPAVATSYPAAFRTDS